MTVDRPQVGGGKIPVLPGTCLACVFNEGPHTCKPRWIGMDLANEPDESVIWAGGNDALLEVLK